MSIRAGVVVTVPLQQVDDTPRAETSADGNDKGLQDSDSGRKDKGYREE